VLHLIPKTFVGALVGDDLLQVLLLALLTGFALLRLGSASAAPVLGGTAPSS
jgi:aerobic C4-dicarboxylate transport protein